MFVLVTIELSSEHVGLTKVLWIYYLRNIRDETFPFSGSHPDTIEHKDVIIFLVLQLRTIRTQYGALKHK